MGQRYRPCDLYGLVGLLLPRFPSKFALLSCLTLAGLLSSQMARAECAQSAGRFVDIHGEVETQVEDGGTWSDATLESILCEGSTIRVGERSRAAIALINDAVLRLDENTTMRLVDITDQEEERSLLDIIRGALHSFSRKPKKLSINSPYLNGSIEGTEFVFRVTDEQSELTVFEGTVIAANDQGRASVAGGESASASAGQAPQARTLVRPRDAAQWSLYYPPVFATGGEQAAAVSPALRRAADDLSAGRVDAAQPKLDQAIAEGADAGLAHALRAVINVVQNRLEQALADANQAVSLNPDSAAAHVALSYVQQASFQIDDARDTLLRAVEKQPEDALAWARLAELELMLGNKRQASEAAQKAVALAPDLGRTQITLGFTALAEFRTADARAAFEKAIELDSADPLPHLGLGLARISAGELQRGRADIEVGVALGSNDALLRAYLGKAYFEEKRAPLDNQQFDIAKQLNPNDPTAWLYDGIARQTQNRPVEAVRQFEQAIALNDNRAAYRSRLLLDQDRAANGTSLARAYNDLGFVQSGVNESTRSLTLDPANAGAHRFLSDTYQGVRRREISRVSELFQAQLLQDVNVNPVQPSISSTNLNIVTLGGPTNAGFNEFTPLFQRNSAQLDVTGLSGSNDSRGGEAVATAVYDRYSLSLGAYDFDTDGYRDNNHISHEIQNFYGQVALSQAVNLQLELRSRTTEHGDLALDFDPDDFEPEFERAFEEDTAHVGLKITPSPASTILVSLIESERDEKQGDGSVESVLAPTPPFFPPGQSIVTTNSFEGDTEEESSQIEAQYIHTAERFNLVAGVSSAEVEQEFNTVDAVIVTFPTPGPPSPPPVINERSESPTIEDMRAYVYANLHQGENIIWTLGLSSQEYEEDAFDYDRVNPKFGLQWDVGDRLRFRAAYIEVIKPALASNRTLEPTQVAGFNQFFDDANGTKSKRYGGALDWRATQDLSLGVELTQRDFGAPEFDPISPTESVAFFDEREERLDRVYAYWAIANNWAFSAQVVYDKYASEASLDFNHPSEITTLSYPLQLQYFHPSGLFVGLGVTWVDQEIDRDNAVLLAPEDRLAQGDSDFTVADLGIGYRFPRRRGFASLAVQNLFDEDFEYQDDSYREFKDEPAIGPYIPERTVMGRITLNF